MSKDSLMKNDESKSRVNIKLIIEYDGTDFKGSQAQKDQRTVQDVMEDAIRKVTGEALRVTGCSRTDAGVHARNYTLNFKTNTTIPPDRILHPLNNLLPSDIRVKWSGEVPMDFNSRKNAKSKTYSYRFTLGTMDLPIGGRYRHTEKTNPDFDKMADAAKLFIGTHDFKAFRSTGTAVKDTVRTIYELELEKEKQDIVMTIKGNGFLYNMVRIIMGTLIEVGNGTKNIKDISDALESGDRKKTGKVAPAKGLILEKVEY
ncbi:MAG: tRNA pseudouridine(38-40) synthase TruA [Clostridiaceae bacterium]